ncbi:hypothetical protein [Dysgonomonas sp. Marseille-P4361]|uniref:hypothetical protein n=1 Tax=Dysgonomonas sp. Marseille-P4361 TaxID=2161820 RepID=UPI000D55AD7C|nr:hypothetical protein [Dysgonomonas sp. Marseille-P4361]
MKDEKRKTHPSSVIVLDKLIISCTSIVEDNFDYAVTHSLEYLHSDFQFGETKLVRTTDPSNRYKYSYKVYHKDTLMGIIDFALYYGNIYTNMLRFSVDNQVFYNDTLKNIPTILEDLNLKINNFKQIDIAVDCYKFNPEQVIRRNLKAKDNTVKLFGNIIKNRDEVLKEITYYNSGSLNNPYELRSILIKGKDKRKEVACYDKAEEIEEISKKEYISEFHLRQNPKSKKIFRIEVRNSYEEIRRYGKKIKRQIAIEDILNNEFLFEMFSDYLDRIITIYKGQGRKKVKIQLVEKPQNLQSKGILQPTLSEPILQEEIAEAYNVNNDIFKYKYDKENKYYILSYNRDIYNERSIRYEILKYELSNLGRIMNIYQKHRYENNKKIKQRA